MRFKRDFFAIVAIFIGCISTITVTEVSLRLVGPDWLKLRMKEVGVSDSIGADLRFFGSDAGFPKVRVNGKFIKFVPFSHFRIEHYEYDVEANIDKWGARRTSRSNDIYNEKFIPFLGDSFTFGVGVKDEETYVSLLDKKFPYPLINLGAPGSCLHNQLDIIEQRHIELNSPHIYIFTFFIGNDFTNLFVKDSMGNDKKEATKLMPLRDKKFTQFLQVVNDFVRQNTFLRKIYFIQFIKSKLLILYNNYLTSKDVIRRMDDEIFHVIQDTKYFKEMQLILDEELLRLTRLAKHLNFKPIFIIIPDRHQVDKDLLALKLKYYGLKNENIDAELPNRVIRKKLESFNIAYLDLLECLKLKHLTSPNVRLYYILDNHLTPEGHRVVADCIFYPFNSLISKYRK